MIKKNEEIKLVIYILILFFILKTLNIHKLINENLFILIILIGFIYYYYYYKTDSNDIKYQYIKKFIKGKDYFYIHPRFIDFLYDIKQHSIFKSYINLINSINEFLYIEEVMYKTLDFQKIDIAIDLYKKSMNLLHSFIYDSKKGMNNYFNENLDNDELDKDYIEDFKDLSLNKRMKELYSIFNIHIEKMKKDSMSLEVNHRSRLADLDKIEANDKVTNFDYF
tara:strand:- start:113 stop:781 length:669 start_codon:yes stop_codon:yes gene_type:complete